MYCTLYFIKIVTRSDLNIINVICTRNFLVEKSETRRKKDRETGEQDRGRAQVCYYRSALFSFFQNEGGTAITVLRTSRRLQHQSRRNGNYQ